MESELQEKISLLDEQILLQSILYDELKKTESIFKNNWLNSSLSREKEIFNKIHEIQSTKQRLISGEKPPEIVYVDKEVPKYITTKEIHINKDGMAKGLLVATFIIYVLIALAYYFNIFTITINV